MEKQGKNLYFEQLLRDNDSLIRGVISRFCKNNTLQKDLYQNIAADIWQSIDKFQNTSKISTWIHQIAVYNSIDFLRHLKKIFTTYSPNCVEVYDFATSTLIEETDTDLETLYQLIEVLSNIDKTIILLYLKGDTHQAIADLLQLPVSTIAMRVCRIKKRLKMVSKR